AARLVAAWRDRKMHAALRHRVSPRRLPTTGLRQTSEAQHRAASSIQLIEYPRRTTTDATCPEPTHPER
ncbi:hypothetical protein ACIBG4_40345, partial [Nonomuraea sp. NPDC050383]|uniref:hypothetical protein n=1 Tax=Nonomuraea sp. NPDC050383 TaxID=3364362 RepID=UPI003799412D